MPDNIIHMPNPTDILREKVDIIITDLCKQIIDNQIPPEISFITLVTLGFSILYNDGIVGEKVAVDSATQIAKTVYSGEGLENE